MPEGMTKGQSAGKEDSEDLQFRVGVQCFYIKVTSKLIKGGQLSILKILEVDIESKPCAEWRMESNPSPTRITCVFPILEKFPCAIMIQSL